MSIPSGSFPQVDNSNNFEMKAEKSPNEIKFLEHLKITQTAFKEYDRIPVDKKKYLDGLEEAYRSLCQLYTESAQFFVKSENLQQISHLFYLLGRSEYPGQMEKSRHFLQAALILKLNALGLTKTDVLKILMAHPSITALQDNLSKEMPNDRSPLTDLPEQIISEHTTSLLDTKNKEHLFELSCNLRWLGHTAQNINALNKDYKRFDIIYGAAKKCNENVIERGDHQLKIDASWEMAELLYNTDRFMIHLQQVETLDPKALALAKLKSLDNVKPFLKFEGDTLRTKTKLAQIENIQAIEKSRMASKEDTQLHEECYQHSCKALEIAKATPNFNPELLNMFKSNNVSFALLAKKIDYAQLKNQMNEVLIYTKENEHFYNSIYIIVAARYFYVSQNNRDKALELLDIADLMANRSPENSKDNLESSKKLRNEILGIKE